MSARKPPSRPPPPRQQAVRTHSAGSSSSPGKTGFRNPFSAISISYRPTNSRSLDDSDEEIQIVRKTKGAGEENSDCEENAEKSCALPTTQCVESNQGSRPEESAVAGSTKPDQNRGSSVTKWSLSQSKSAHELSLYSSTDSFAVENQKSWPSKNADAHPPIPMRFLKAKGQSGNKPELSKSEPSLSTEHDEQADVGSHSSRSHLDVESETTSRERSPSPFRRFLKRETENSDSASSCERDKQPESAISLSSLLASERESRILNSENEDSWEHIEDESDDEELYVDAVSEPIKKDNFEVPKTKTSPPTRDKTPSSTAFFLCVLLFYMYIVSTPTPFVSGVVVGSLLAYLIGCAFLWLFCPEDSVSERYIRELNEYNERLRMTPLPDYKSVDPGLLLRPRELKGWMYKAKNYELDHFDFSGAVPVFAALKNEKLKLSHPRPDVNGKRIDPRTVDENAYITYISHDQYDLRGAKVHLVPLNIPVKRVWSRKFPIRVVLSTPGQAHEDSDDNSDDEDFGSSVISKLKKLNSFDNDLVDTIFYLFARTGREKEDWYNALQSVLIQKKTSGSESELSTNLSCSYPHYMASLLPVPGTSESQSQIAWVNVMFGRAFWDVWQDKNWSDRIKLRFQNKLGKLKKPSFIRDIKIVDLSLGHSLPIINKASPPVVDERGTWVDLDVTYSGGLVFSLEGHLNVEGYLAAFISLGQDSDVTSDLDMAELVKKYEIVEEVTNAAESTASESETASSSDSEFESPESDFEDADDNSASNLGVEQLVNVTDSSSSGAESNSTEEHRTNSPSANNSATHGEQTVANGKSEGSVSRQSSAEKESVESDNAEKLPVFTAGLMEAAKRVPSGKMSAHTGAKKKIFGVIERLAKSKWVKRAAETGIVKRAAERFSNLPITLSVEVQAVKGTIALNIPPPPTNRLWFGFRGGPMLFVSARPKLGERQVKLTHVTEWIEKKLKQEFKNMFVLPNMEDLPIKIMHSGLDEQFTE